MVELADRRQGRALAQPIELAVAVAAQQVQDGRHREARVRCHCSSPLGWRMNRWVFRAVVIVIFVGVPAWIVAVGIRLFPYTEMGTALPFWANALRSMCGSSLGSRLSCSRACST